MGPLDCVHTFWPCTCLATHAQTECAVQCHSVCWYARSLKQSAPVEAVLQMPAHTHTASLAGELALQPNAHLTAGRSYMAVTSDSTLSTPACQSMQAVFVGTCCVCGGGRSVPPARHQQDCLMRFARADMAGRGPQMASQNTVASTNRVLFSHCTGILLSVLSRHRLLGATDMAFRWPARTRWPAQTGFCSPTARASCCPSCRATDC